MTNAASTPQGTVLRDGTRFDDLMNHERREMSSRVHADPEIFELELEKLFAKAWIVVGHVTEIEEPGAFVTRRIGRDPVIVARDSEGEIRVMLNACMHRGMELCRADHGKTLAHRCAFHGWTYGADGDLLAIPFERVIYGKHQSRDQRGLVQARVGVYAGLIFATFDAEAPSLDEYLGDFKWYMDMMYNRTDRGLEVAGPPSRYVAHANWKVVAEGFFADAYHVMTVHKSFMDLGFLPNDDAPLYDFKSSVDGHSVLCTDFVKHGIVGTPDEIFAKLPPCGMPPELVEQMPRHLSTEQIEMLATTPPSISAIFPSTSFLMISGGASGVLGATVSLRFFVPLSHDRTEIMNFSLVERDASPEFKELVHRSSNASFGVAGFFEPDDLEAWSGVRRATSGVVGSRLDLDYSSVGVPLTTGTKTDRPGITYRGVSTDDNQWFFYKRYFDFMNDRAWETTGQGTGGKG